MVHLPNGKKIGFLSCLSPIGAVKAENYPMFDIRDEVALSNVIKRCRYVLFVMYGVKGV